MRRIDWLSRQAPFQMEEPRNLPYGDRRAMIKDRWGNIWQIATHLPAELSFERS